MKIGIITGKTWELTSFKPYDIVLVEVEYEDCNIKQYPVLLTIIESRNRRQLAGRSLIPCRAVVAPEIVVYDDEQVTMDFRKLYGNFTFSLQFTGIKKIMSKKDLKIFTLETEYAI